ncbi:NAD(+) diphosphatase [Humibacter ginsenosidimutans]|uniref:NAD(+) diphosphatase n=1 Tax=Humibacter ginsenosidimutans TaxID=2599293 RepID=A0A5B8M1X8_9MICO|nr:NAD(+) diphosphatase [Humibacter ginsenosidimutans]QDZ14353.1 NAD(+) diphosphatase [Humibacter ginsenosidimutans]
MPRPLGDLPLARSAVDRDGAHRARADLFDELLAEDATRVLPLWNGRVLVRDVPAGADSASPSTRLTLFRTDEVTSALTRVYLGRTLTASDDEPAGTPVILAVLTDAAAGELQPDEQRWRGLRELATTLGDRDAGLVTESVAIANWHASHTHCPRCGTPTVVEQGGWMRRCFVDNNEIFPRTDPAVIVRVLDDQNRILLGSNALWENNRWSLLAGFVEAGESFEAAAAREVAEESGVVVVDPVYLGSQPWPFPASIMIGMEARAVPGSTQLQPDGEEILALRWFSRDDIWAERDDILLPGGSSIAHEIVRDWYGGPLDEPPPAAGTQASAGEPRTDAV